MDQLSRKSRNQLLLPIQVRKTLRFPAEKRPQDSTGEKILGNFCNFQFAVINWVPRSNREHDADQIWSILIPAIATARLLPCNTLKSAVIWLNFLAMTKGVDYLLLPTPLMVLLLFSVFQWGEIEATRPSPVLHAFSCASIHVTNFS